MGVPNTVSHKIDEESPFYSLTPESLLSSDFELVVYFEGIVESTGSTVQARTSYLPREILWGCIFKNMVRDKDVIPLLKKHLMTSNQSKAFICMVLKLNQAFTDFSRQSEHKIQLKYFLLDSSKFNP